MADKNLFYKEYSFYGRQAQMAIELTQKIDDSSTVIFPTVIDLFIMSAIVGVSNNHKAKADPDKSTDKKIFGDQFRSHMDDLKLAFKFVTLLGNQDKYDDITRLNKTFRNPETDENYKEFEEYMLGGLNDIYDAIMLDTNHSFNEYLSSIYKFVDAYKNDSETTNVTIPSTDDFF